MYTIDDVLDSILNEERRQAWSQMTSSSAVEPIQVFKILTRDEILRMLQVGIHCGFIEVKHLDS